jgi:YjjI family glycine radical enzyme
MDTTTLREAARDTVTSPHLTYRQRLHRLAQVGESLLDPPKVGPQAQAALETGLICDLHEGPAPYRPRYLLPDYARALKQGSAFLELDPPEDLDDAIAFLSILYHHVPSITSYPVFFGDLDVLLEPFAEGVDDARLHRTLTRFWRYLDRTLPDAFAHANIGPFDGRVARMILRVDRELGQVVPNLTLKWDPEVSGHALLDEATRSIVAVNKPHIANHMMIQRDFPAATFPQGYGVVSCYNTLPVGGGSHTLVRLNLAESAARHSGDIDDYLRKTLPAHLELLAEVMCARVRFLVEEARFYDHGFLVEEGLIDPSRFTAMAGLYGVAEAVDLLLGGDRIYGVEPDANELGHQISATAAAKVASSPMPYCVDGHAMLHAQSGISEDVAVTAGARIPTGREPDTISHILAVAPHHRLFASGISDIFALEPTVRDNPSALSDLTRGAFAAGLREITFDVDGCDLVRITGYMVRRSEVERSRKAEVLHGSTVLGAEAMDNRQVLERTHRVISTESSPFALRAPS